MYSYDPNKQYGDYTEVVEYSDEERKRKERSPDNEEVSGEPTVVDEVDHGDGTFTITYSDGTVKKVTKGSSQSEKNKKYNEGKMGLEMFVYGGPKKLNKYQDGKNDWRDEKVHDFLEYHPNFPRTGPVPYTGNFTAEELQNAITRDSTSIEQSLDDSWFLRNFIGQDQTHQSNLGPSGKLQLNREWLHKLLMQDDQERAERLNFYKDGGSLPFYQEGKNDDEETDSNKNKSKGPNDPPSDKNEEEVEVPVDNTEEVVEEAVVEEATNIDENKSLDEDEVSNFTEEELEEMQNTSMDDSGIIEQTYGTGMQGAQNRFDAATKTGIVDRAINTFGDIVDTGLSWVDAANAWFNKKDERVAKAKAQNEGQTAADQFVTQESNQGIHDPNTGDAWINKKVDEIYSGNTMKAPMFLQQGGNPQQMAQPVVDNVNYAALAEFTGSNPWGTEIAYSPEVLAYQRRIMAKMARGGQLPMAQDGWWDKTKDWWKETDFKTPINKALDVTQTTLSGAGMIPGVGIIPDAINTAVSSGRLGYAAATGDEEGVSDHTKSLALNAASMVPVAGQGAGAVSLASDVKKYASSDDKTKTITENRKDVKIDKVAKHGGEQEVEVDYETLQELIKAGADIEIL
jgi:hypothetical protein